DVLRDPAVAALEHLAARVDEEVVPDVVPTVSPHVVDLDAAHDRCGLVARVRVRGDGVVHERELQCRSKARLPTANLLLGVPAGARDDLRRACDLKRAAAVPNRWAPEQVLAHA